MQGELFSHEHSQAAAWVARGGCSVSVLGGFQSLNGLRPEHPGLTSELPLL